MNKLKIVLIGTKGYEIDEDKVRIDSYEWFELKKIKNIKDYDIVLLNLLDINEEEYGEKVNWEIFCKLFTFNSIIHILQNGAIYVIGDPRFKIKNKTKNEILFTYWTGLQFTWDPEPGDTVSFNDPYPHRFETHENYINYLKKWDYSLKDVNIDKSVVSQYFDLEKLDKKYHKLRIDKYFYCINRYKYALSFGLNYCIVKYGTYNFGYREDIKREYGSIVFLPKISLNYDDTILFILNDVFKLPLKSPVPEWLENIIVPDQTDVEEKIKKIEKQISILSDNLNNANIERSNKRECLKLLYETDFELERIVRKILAELGAEVEEPKEKNKEDGWIKVKVADKILEGVLEIKSTKSNQFDERGRKQLLDWVNRGINNRQKKYKGLFIGNSATDKKPWERPASFSDNWIKSAKLGEICAIKTEHLLGIYILSFEKDFEVIEFWKDLFNTSGIFNFKKYINLLSDEKRKLFIP